MKSFPSKLTISIFIYLLILSLNSCSDNPVVSNLNTVTGFYGKLYFLDFEKKILQPRLFLDSGFASMGIDTVSSSDSLINLTLSTPSQQYLKPIREITSLYDLNLFVSNPDAKATNFLNNYFLDSINGNVSGGLSRGNSPGNTKLYEGLYNVRFAYCDRSVKISGTVINIFSIIGPPDTFKYNVNINLSKGWNPVTYKTKYIRDYYGEYDVSDGDPGDSKWFYIPQFSQENYNEKWFPYSQKKKSN